MKCPYCQKELRIGAVFHETNSYEYWLENGELKNKLIAKIIDYSHNAYCAECGKQIIKFMGLPEGEEEIIKKYLLGKTK